MSPAARRGLSGFRQIGIRQKTPSSTCKSSFGSLSSSLMRVNTPTTSFSRGLILEFSIWQRTLRVGRSSFRRLRPRSSRETVYWLLGPGHRDPIPFGTESVGGSAEASSLGIGLSSVLRLRDNASWLCPGFRGSRGKSIIGLRWRSSFRCIGRITTIPC